MTKLVLATSLALSTFVLGVSLYDETIDGDFSNDYLNPTSLNLKTGSNQISGSLFGASIDVDLFTFRLGPGEALSAIRVLEFSTFGIGGSFLGMQSGTQLSANPALGNAFPDAVGGRVFTAADAAVDRDILPFVVMFPPFNSVNPLPEGDYVVWLNETGQPTQYTLDFVVVPEPSSLVPLGLSVFLFRRWRK
ncbi:MAG: PEP-CTERM sorting domain-containing protein [Roseibacillus sp.]